MAALYSIYDVEKALLDNISNYVRVEIDGVDSGLVYRLDLLDSLSKKYGYLTSARKKNSKITSLKIYGKEHEVKHSIRIYNASPDEMFKYIFRKEEEVEENQRNESTVSFDEDSEDKGSIRQMSMFGIQGSPRIDVPSLNRISLTNGDKDENVAVKKQTDGLFDRFKRWLQGDRRYKK